MRARESALGRGQSGGRSRRAQRLRECAANCSRVGPASRRRQAACPLVARSFFGAHIVLAICATRCASSPARLSFFPRPKAIAAPRSRLFMQINLAPFGRPRARATDLSHRPARNTHRRCMTRVSTGEGSREWIAKCRFKADGCCGEMRFRGRRFFGVKTRGNFDVAEV